MSPELICVCGCNGVGKSTFINSVYLLDNNYKNYTYINPDEIASKGNITNIEAGKIAIKLLNNSLNNHYNIIKESTLVSNLDFKIIEQAKNFGYIVHMDYIGVSSSSVSIERVHARVATGGHSIDDDVVAKRYIKSIKNIENALTLIDSAVLYDNSGHAYCCFATVEQGFLYTCASVPVWAQNAVSALEQRFGAEERNAPGFF